MYRIELIWNREFHWVSYGKSSKTLKEANESAISIRDSGDGARVKKVRIIEIESDKVVWNG